MGYQTPLHRIFAFSTESAILLIILFFIQNVFNMYQGRGRTNVIAYMMQDRKEMGKKDICPTFLNGEDFKLHAIFRVKLHLQSSIGHQGTGTHKNDQNCLL